MTPEKEIPEDWIGFGSEDDLSFGCLSFDSMDSQDLMSAADGCVAKQVVAQDQDTPAVEYNSIVWTTQRTQEKAPYFGFGTSVPSD